jgi:hypothetical protein
MSPDENQLPAVPPTQEMFALFDRQDDTAVIARIRGAALKEYVYAFRQGGKWIYGLGVDGAEACKREMARLGEVIREDDIELMREDEEYAYFKAKASRWAVKLGEPDARLDTAVELKRQAKYITLRDGTTEDNLFWFEQGGSKAMRNAVLNLVPETIKQKVIAEYKQVAKIVESRPEGTEPGREGNGEAGERGAERPTGEKASATINEGQIRKLKAIARGTGWDDARLAEVLRARGYTALEQVRVGDYTALENALKTERRGQ